MVCNRTQLQKDVLRLQVGLNVVSGEGASPVPELQDSICTCLMLGGPLVAFLALSSSAAQELKSLQLSVHKDAITETFRLAKDLPHHFLTRGEAQVDVSLGLAGSRCCLGAQGGESHKRRRDFRGLLRSQGVQVRSNSS